MCKILPEIQGTLSGLIGVLTARALLQVQPILFGQKLGHVWGRPTGELELDLNSQRPETVLILPFLVSHPLTTMIYWRPVLMCNKKIHEMKLIVASNLFLQVLVIFIAVGMTWEILPMWLRTKFQRWHIRGEKSSSKFISHICVHGQVRCFL